MKIEDFISEKEIIFSKDVNEKEFWYEEAREHYVGISEKIEKPDLYGKTLLIGERQFEKIYKMSVEISDILKMKVPSIYVYEDFYEGLEAKGIEEPWIEMSSKTITDFSDKEIKFLLARALCEIKLKHTEKKMIFSEYFKIIGELPIVKNLNKENLLEDASKVRFFKWMRASVYTEDNFAYLIVGDIDSCVSAILKTILNSTFLANNINVSEYIKQAEKINLLEGDVYDYTKLDEKVPYGPFRIKNLISFASSRRGMGVII